MDDRLYRSRTDRVISGVAGGLAERLNMDPSIVRVVWVVLAIVSGGLFALVYLVMMIVVPEAPDDWQPRAGAGGAEPWSSFGAAGGTSTPPATGGSVSGFSQAGEPADVDDTVAYATPPPAPASESRPWGPTPAPRPRHRGDRGGGLILGLILILVGGYCLIRQYIPAIDLDITWPVVVVVVGVLLVILAFMPDRSRR